MIANHTQEPCRRAGFSMIELLVSMTVLAVLLGIIAGALSSVSGIYVKTDGKTRAEEKGRAVMELLTREVTPAVIDTRMQYVIMPGEKFSDVGALDVVPSSPSMFWMAPLGPGGDLRCVGYFLTANDDQKSYRLKRIYIKGDNESGYFPKAVNLNDAADLESRTSPVDADWFTDNWDGDAFDDVTEDNDKVVVSTVAEGVVAFWVRPLDLMGSGIPLLSSSDIHPASDLVYNSSAYFYMADGTPFDDGATFTYLKKKRLTLKANRLPASLELAIVLLDDDDIASGGVVPPQEDVLDADSGALDLEASIRDYTETLKTGGYSAPRIFRTSVKLANGG